MDNQLDHSSTIDITFTKIIEIILAAKYFIIFVIILSLIPFFYERQTREISYFGEINFLNSYPYINDDLGKLSNSNTYFNFYKKNITVSNGKIIDNIIKSYNEENGIDYSPYENQLRNFDLEIIEQNDFPLDSNFQFLKLNLTVGDFVPDAKFITSYLKDLAIRAHYETLNDLEIYFLRTLNQKNNKFNSRMEESKSYYKVLKTILEEHLALATQLQLTKPIEGISPLLGKDFDSLSFNYFLLGTEFIDQRLADVEKRILVNDPIIVLSDPYLLESRKGLTGLSQFQSLTNSIKNLESYLEGSKHLNTQQHDEFIIIHEVKEVKLLQAIPAYPYLTIIFSPFVAIFIAILFHAYRRYSK